MNRRKKSLNKTTRRIGVWFFMVVLCFTFALHGADWQRSLFRENPGLLNQKSNDNQLFGKFAGPAGGIHLDREEFLEFEYQPVVSRKKFFLEISVGVLCNIASAIACGIAGSLILKGDGGSDDIGKGLGAVGGAFIGSTMGSALGVYVVGNSGDHKGSFGQALLGSLLGEAAALGAAVLTRNEYIGILSFAVLPPLGAALLFNKSLEDRALPVSHALLNFSGDKCKIGIPYFHIRPFPVYAKNAKPVLRFDINLVSIVL